ncbi:MAG: hypothetical protein Q8P41_28560 [Pseudomonadota bacterium]|nr:hypothetical protein [Pseudomonadota bacterium]
MSLNDALTRLTADPRDREAAETLVAGLHRLGRILAAERGLDSATGEQVAQDLLVHIWSQVVAGTLNVGNADAWVRRALSNRLLDVLRRVRTKGVDAEELERLGGSHGPMGSDPVARFKAAFAAASEARRAQDREALATAWRRFWRTVDESRTLDAVVREEDPRANVGSAQRAHARMAEAVCEHADEDDVRGFRELLNLRVLSGGSGAARHRDGEP